MNLKKLLSLALILSPSIAAAGQENAEVDLPKLVSILTETQAKACVYDTKVYSVGAIIKTSSGAVLKCEFQSGTMNGLKAGAKWEPSR